MLKVSVTWRTSLATSSSSSTFERQAYEYSQWVSKPQWNPLRELKVPIRKSIGGEPTLDGMIDRAGYQLFRDGMLVQQPIRGYFAHRSNTVDLAPVERRRLEKAQQAAESFMKKHGVVVRRSIRDSALVIGADEAGRGPLAGPVSAAAVCRIPRSSFNNAEQALYDVKEPFAVNDSKAMTDAQRRQVFTHITGASTFFDLADSKSFTVHHASDDPAPDGGLSSKRFPSHAKLSKLPFRKLLSMQTPFLISYHGYHSDPYYLYFWAAGLANHSYIDRYNIYRASMSSIHRCSLLVWKMLSDARMSYELAPRPRQTSIAQYLFTRFCVLACHDEEECFVPPEHINVDLEAAEFFDFDPVQPPLVLVDGHGVPEESQVFFSDIQVGGSVQPVIEGDRRSYSIAAASSLAKVARDEMMEYLHTLYPAYQFCVNKGYPVEHHMKAVERHGVSPIHRKSYKPCTKAIEKGLKKKAKQAKG